MSQIQVELQEWMGDDAAIANAAWTSSYDKSKREETDDENKIALLVRRLVEEGHSTPLESVVMRFWVRWPVFVDRQHMTHRMQSSSGMSGRYRTLLDDFFELPKDVLDIYSKINCDSKKSALHWFDHMRSIYAGYEESLNLLKRNQEAGTITNNEYKRVREVLRSVLPTAFMVERTFIMNLVSFANYQRLRNSPHAQVEIRQAAQMMLDAVIAREVAPVAIAALTEKKWVL